LMPLEAPESGWVWVSVPLDEAIDLIVVGDVQTWYSHWYRAPGARRPEALRCVLADAGRCELCRAGYERRARYVLPVRQGGELRCVEFGRVQYPALCLLQECGGVVGSVLRVTRERPHKSAPIRLREIDRVVVPESERVDLTGYVSAIGLIQMRLLSDEAVRAATGTELRLVSGGKRDRTG